MKAEIFDTRKCLLGEGPLWHPQRQQLFWFDILNCTLHSREGDEAKSWVFDEFVSAAGWVDENTLLVSSETQLFSFDLVSGTQTHIAPIEADNAATRSNDGRADPWGGFWASTMGKSAESEAGSIYRFYRGKVEKLFSGISIPNAICFTPDRRFAHFADTKKAMVKRVALDPETGRPAGEPEIFLDLADQRLNPDGAVIDSEGVMWLAQWGGARVAAYDASGTFLRAVEVGGPQASCPAFGGADFSTLYCTTARENMTDEALAQHPDSGMVFSSTGVAKGQREHQVVLS